MLLLGFAIYRLTPIAFEALQSTLLWYHWAALALNVLFMAYAEGYRGFQKAFSPRVAARCRYLYENPSLVRTLLAPLFCMGYFAAYRRRQVSVVLLTVGIIILVIVVQRLDQPWKGILDAGVVVGLAWGIVATAVFCVLALTREDFPYSPELPEHTLRDMS